jgi:hypothetical protein
VPSSSAPLPKPALKHHETHHHPNKICLPPLSSLSSLSSSLALFLFVCRPISVRRTPVHVCTVVDGLSIPFFSAGRHTLTMSRSLVVDQPDWVLWVRGDTPRVDTERIANASENPAAERDWIDRRELLDLPDSVPSSAGSSKRTVKIDVCDNPWHLTFLTYSFARRFPEPGGSKARALSSCKSMLSSQLRTKHQMPDAIADACLCA